MKEIKNNIHDVVIQPSKKLYRYNLGVDIPRNWSSEYVSPEYIYPDLGQKIK